MDNVIIKIWWDEKSQNTLLFANTRCGLWHMPVGVECKDGKLTYSYWLISITKTSEYGLENKKKNKTIFTLIDIKTRDSFFFPG